jgi:hypothetical protein
MCEGKSGVPCEQLQNWSMKSRTKHDEQISASLIVPTPPFSQDGRTTNLMRSDILCGMIMLLCLRGFAGTTASLVIGGTVSPRFESMSSFQAAGIKPGIANQFYHLGVIRCQIALGKQVTIESGPASQRIEGKVNGSYYDFFIQVRPAVMNVVTISMN